jgi:hypothetical protein
MPRIPDVHQERFLLVICNSYFQYRLYLCRFDNK